MNDFSAFSEIECIKRMDHGCYNMFMDMLKYYAPKLETRIVLNGSAFTSHDAYHCLDIYKIISSCLLRENTAYRDGLGLSKRELFILNLAVLFHDIGMSNSLEARRDNHSELSAEYVQKEYDDIRSMLRSQTDLTVSEVKAMKAIIKAHSNIKGDASIPKERNGIRLPELKKEYKDLHSKPIKALFLAGLLRLADELDVTSERLGNGTLENEIQEGKKKILKYEAEGNTQELQKWAGFLESEKHWKRLHYFESISLSVDKTGIELLVDDEYVEQMLDQGSTEKAIANDIVEILSKIRGELEEIKTIAFADSDVNILVYVQKIDVMSMTEKLQEEINKAQARVSMPVVQKEDNEFREEKKDESVIEAIKNEPIEFDEELSKYLEEEVRERQLLQFGHYVLNEEYCARDWLNIRELVETREISKKIVGSIVKHINSREPENVVILGMDMVGALLAARIAFELKFPMSYFVSVKNERYNSTQEIDFELKEGEKVIIITESIATFKTLKNAIERYGLEEKIDSIYTVFYRKTLLNIKKADDLVKKTYSINNSFPIELVEKRKCTYRKEKCFAKNNH